jgi:MarR family 2-MHQ and catechol resistance regulon transcriptional repressor
MIVMRKMFDALSDSLAPQWKELGINETEFFTLFALDANGPLSIQDIGSKVHLTSGTMTYVINKLEKKAYIKRVQCEEDRRKFFVELTKEGKDFWDKIIELHMTHMDAAFSHVDEDLVLDTIEKMKKIGKK